MWHIRNRKISFNRSEVKREVTDINYNLIGAMALISATNYFF
jgi:hypothetical protein